MTDHQRQEETDRAESRLSVVFYLAFAAMMVAAVAILPIVADAHRLSAMWVTFCAAFGFN